MKLDFLNLTGSLVQYTTDLLCDVDGKSMSLGRVSFFLSIILLTIYTVAVLVGFFQKLSVGELAFLAIPLTTLPPALLAYIAKRTKDDSEGPGVGNE